jgi:hypothetical protein
VCKMGAQLINCTEVCGAAAEKPRSCGSKQPYGGLVDRVWRLGLQAKAKAATMAKVEEKSSTTYLFFFSYSRFSQFSQRKVFSLFVWEISIIGAKYFSLSLSPGFLNFLRGKFSLFSSTLTMALRWRVPEIQIIFQV